MPPALAPQICADSIQNTPHDHRQFRSGFYAIHHPSGPGCRGCLLVRRRLQHWAHRGPPVACLPDAVSADPRIASGLAGALASLSLGLVLPSGANGASFSRARKQLRAWHLKPAPLFPSRAPAHHRHANVHLYRFAGVDYSADFGTPDNAACHTISPNAWCVSLRRSAWSDLARVLDNPRTYTNQRWVRAGKRRVLFYLAQNNAGGWWMSWRERGRTYNVWSWSGRRIALKRLTPFVKGLRPLR